MTAVLAASICAGAAPAAAAPWGRPFRISAPGASALTPAVAVNAAGDAVVVWIKTAQGSPVALRAARGSLGRGFGRVATLGPDSLGIPGNPASPPAVAIDRRGDSLAVWIRGTEVRTSRVVAAYVVFGVGFGLVNAPITNTAVSGMPRSRAGLAAAIASTSRQVGASLGVAIGGTIAQGRRGVTSELTAGMHAFFALAALAGLGIVALGVLSSTAWGQETLRRAATLIEEGDRGSSAGTP